MKPFITPELTATGKKVLAFQCEGVASDALSNAVKGRNIVAYSMPVGHSFQAAWVFRLILEGDDLFEFSSACTQVVGWHEVGSLSIRFVKGSNKGRADATPDLEAIAIPVFRVLALEKLVYEDADVVSECALVLRGEDGEEIVVAAGIPPGSVSVTAPFTEGLFEPQFTLASCRRDAV